MVPLSTFAIEAHRRRKILSLLSVGVAALCLPAFLTQEFTGNFLRDGSNGETNSLSLDELEHDVHMRRLLTESIDDEDYADLAFPDWLLRATGEMGEKGHQSVESAMAAAFAESPPIYPQPDLKPYTIADTVQESRLFKNTYGILVYDPESDDFLFLYDEHQNWVSGCTKLKTSYRIFAMLLRKTFPERFQGPGSPEFAIGITSGDYPHLDKKCLSNFPHASDWCKRDNSAPILQFGSVFRSAEVFPNMIAMPMPEGLSLYCFKFWVATNGRQVCQNWRPAGNGGSLAFGEEFGLEWEDLKPQVVWRGTDFGFLNHIESTLHQPSFTRDFATVIDAAAEESDAEKKALVTRAMRDAYDELYPRWKGVVLTAEAEQEAEEKGKGAMPWIDVKFSGASPSARGTGPEYEKFEEYDISPVGGRMDLNQLAGYKYHIDLGGGGGTTWSGTIHKLAMPGLLFHHMTPTKDWFHDKVKAWQHFIPVAPDLSDLKEKYEWAESHPKAAKIIADQGSEMMRHLSTHEGFGEMFQEVVVETARRVIEAYQPVEITHPGMSWREAIREVLGESNTRYIAVKERCPGLTGREQECTKNEERLF